MTGTPTPSIRRRLLVMLISSIMLVWLIALVLVYRAAEHEVEEVFDRDLVRSSRILQTLLLHEVEEEREMAARVGNVVRELGPEGMRRYPQLAAILREYTDESAQERLELVGVAERAGQRYGKGLTFIARYSDGGVMVRDRDAPDIPITPEGFSDVRLADQTWRVYSLTDSGSGFLVQAGEPLASRSELVRYITRNTLAPMLIALPLMGVLIWWVVGRALAPLQRITREVSMRDPDALGAIDDSRSPHEIQALLRALNQLFARLRSAIERERQFTADAAHELRTPLAALKAHLQVARMESAEDATRESLAAALQGVDRATHSVEQLLALARTDAEGDRVLDDAEVDLQDLALWGVAEFSQRAYERGIDLGVGDVCPAVVHGDRNALQILLRNLVDNAVRHTSRGGTVTVNVGCMDGRNWIEVLDDGPGVAAGERERIFDRFNRGAGEISGMSSGSGLGLSIVQRIARLHRAEITLGDGVGGRGLGVRLAFPGRV
jgi:two-component system sensor histidine kinase QseC